MDIHFTLSAALHVFQLPVIITLVDDFVEKPDQHLLAYLLHVKLLKFRNYPDRYFYCFILLTVNYNMRLATTVSHVQKLQNEEYSKIYKPVVNDSI